jgi:hypothetical protein
VQQLGGERSNDSTCSLGSPAIASCSRS